MRRATVVALLVMAILAAMGTPVASAQDPIQVLDIDRYDRTLIPGETTGFNWTVRNSDVVPYDIGVNAVAASGWSVLVTPSFIGNLSPNRAAAVAVSLTAPPRISAEAILELSVTFTVFQDGAIVFIATRTATATIPSIYAEKRVLGLFDNPLPAPFDNEWGVFLVNVVLWLGLSGGTLLILTPILRRIGRHTRLHVAEVVMRAIRVPLFVVLFLYGALQSLDALERHLDPRIEEALFAIYQVALAIIILYLAYRLFRDVAIHLARTISQRTESRVDDVLVPLAEKVGLAILGLVGLGLILGYLNVNLTLFIAGGVVTSMVVAFAAQDTLSNFFSGIFLLTDRPFKEGDVVILSDGDWCEVRKIGVRSTRLFRFSDASLVTLPNNRLLNDKIANFSNPHDKGRLMMTFAVGYGSDVRKVKTILREVIAGNDHILQDDPTCPIVRFDVMGDSALSFFVLVWIDHRDHRFDVRDYLNTEIYRRFMEAGIEIPFPQRTVHVRLDADERGIPPLELEEFPRRSERSTAEGEDPSSRRSTG